MMTSPEVMNGREQWPLEGVLGRSFVEPGRVHGRILYRVMGGGGFGVIPFWGMAIALYGTT